jgi:hypothetical protein
MRDCPYNDLRSGAGLILPPRRGQGTIESVVGVIGHPFAAMEGERRPRGRVCHYVLVFI